MRLRGSRLLWLILAVALAVRVGVIVATPDFHPIFDAAHYDRLGASIAAGDGYPGQFQPPTPSAFRPPLYPFALAAVHLLGGGWTAGRLLGALLGVLTVLLVAVVAERLWSRRVALVAAAITAVFPPLVLLNASLLSESLFVPLALAVLLATLQYRRSGAARWALAAGVLCGLAALTRVNGLVLVVAAGAGVWGGPPRWSARALAAPAVIVAATALTVMPWVVRNAIAFDRFVGISTQSGYAIGATYNPQSGALHPAGRPTQTWLVRDFRDLYRDRSLDEGRRSSRLTSRAVDYATAHPGYVAGTVAWNSLRVFDAHHDGPFKLSFQALYLQALGDRRLASPLVPATVWLLVAVAVAGVALEIRRPRAPLFVWLFPLLLVAPAVAVYGLARYRAPVDPFLAMLAAVALAGDFDVAHGDAA